MYINVHIYIFMTFHLSQSQLETPNFLFTPSALIVASFSSEKLTTVFRRFSVTLTDTFMSFQGLCCKLSIHHPVIKHGIFLAINLHSVRGFSSQPCLMKPEGKSQEIPLKHHFPIVCHEIPKAVC